MPEVLASGCLTALFPPCLPTSMLKSTNMSATIHVVANNANRERDTSLMAERTPKKRRRLPRRKWIILAGVKSLLATALQFTAVECRVLRAVSAQEPSETDGNKGKYLHSSKVVSKVVSVRSVRGWTTPKRGCT